MIAPSPRPPQVRARYMQSFLKGLGRLPEDDQRALNAALGVSIVNRITSAPILGWLPLSVNVDYTKVVVAQLGRERADSFFRDLILEVTDSPLLHGFVRSALRVTIPDPALYLPWIGKGWDLLFRDCGRFTAKRRGDTGAILELRGLPPEALAERVWIDRIAVSIGALAALLDFDAVVATSQVDASTGTAVYVARWRTREKARVR